MAEYDLELDLLSLPTLPSLPSLPDTTLNHLEDIYVGQNKPSDNLIDLSAEIVNDRGEFDNILTDQDDEGDTLLHVSILSTLTTVALSLIKLMHPEQLNIANNMKQTALHIAAHIINISVLKSLIEHGADITIQDNKGRTVMHILCEKGDSQSMKLLSEFPTMKSANVTNACTVTFQKITECLAIKNYEGQTCFHIACEKSNKHALTTLLEIGMDINIQESKAGKTALHIAAEQGNVAVVKFLVKQRDIDLEKKTYDGMTPLIGAYHREHHNVVGALRNAGAAMNNRELKKFGALQRKIST